MKKYLIKNESEWGQKEFEIKGCNIEFNSKSPERFPCIAIIAYAGTGADEIDYCYPDEFCKKEKEFSEGLNDIKKDLKAINELCFQNTKTSMKTNNMVRKWDFEGVPDRRVVEL